MQTRTAERIEEWGTRPFSGGVEGLRELTDRGFSGAIDAGPWVFVLNGRVVGTVGGGLDDVGSGTAYVAPHDSLPLLFVMLERGGERRGRYYTGETPIEAVDGTLRDGGFTGYLELSENVLSGDYYLVYYGGERRACAFVGQAERLYTGEEAFERAVNEVGIYTVTAVDVGVVELPGSGTAPGSGPTADVDVDVDGPGQGVGSATGSGLDATGDHSPDPDPGFESGSGSGSEPYADPALDRGSGTEMGDGSDSGPDRGSATGIDAGGDDEPRPSPGRLDDIEAAGSPSDPDVEVEAEAEAGVGADSRAPSPAPAPGGADLEPAVRPVEAASPSTDTAASDSGRARGAAADSSAGTGVGPPEGTAEGATTADPDRLRTLRAERAELEEENDRLGAKLSAARERVTRLESEVSRLEEQVRELQADDEPGTDRTLSLDPEEALAGTSLFVRYGDKGTATLRDALVGGSEREAVRENLSLEHHTTFDSGSAAVDGDPFERFLKGSLEFGVASWLVREFPYGVVDTGHVDDLGALYEAIPEVDRIELRGSVDVGDDDDDRTVEFDVVCRNRMGAPLVVVDLHGSREPAGADQMGTLLESAGTVAETNETLAGAILVTASFFDPPALKTAEEATGGGRLFGSGPTSFVRLSRRAGYHLCLVEAREGRFHVAMPDL